jgi:hypothetical protein
MSQERIEKRKQNRKKVAMKGRGNKVKGKKKRKFKKGEKEMGGIKCEGGNRRGAFNIIITIIIVAVVV